MLTACEKTRNVNLKMINETSDTVWIDYLKIGGYQQDSDSCNVYIPPGTSVKLQEYVVKDHPYHYTDDWFYVYRLYIYLVANETGDEINIDPNECRYLKFLEAESETFYSIELNDTMF